MKINLMYAADRLGGIGYKGKLPWPTLKEDLERFRQVTMGHIVVMGRKTWDCLDHKPLDGRVNIVLSRTPWKGHRQEHSTDTWFMQSFDQIFEFYEKCWPGPIAGPEIFVIGGQQIFELVLNDVSIAKHLFISYHTIIWASLKHDVQFPYHAKFGWGAYWHDILEDVKTEPEFPYNYQFGRALFMGV